MAQNQDGISQEDEVIPPYNPRHRFSMAFKRASYHAPDEIWNLFSEAEDCCDIIDYFNALIKALNIDPNTHGLEFYDILKSKLTSWKCQSLWDLLNARQKHAEYKHGKAAKGKTCVVIGCGPIGLRTAIECLFLGCKTLIVEKREEFARNNVLHLWPFLMTDFRNLGAKKFYGKFGAGCIEHINIRTLQCILLKVALILGAEVFVGVSFVELVEPINEETGWRATFQPENHVLSKFEFDIVIGADGKKNILPGFEQIELRGALAIGITCNFVNNNTIEEARVNEISGISFQYNQEFFIKMEEQYGVRLENIVYYKDETHYFVMTALKSSLLKLNVLKEDFSNPKSLFASSNIDKEKLIEFTRCAVQYSTNHQLPDDLEFKQLSNGEPDIALFDFTSLKKASNASRIIERKKKKLLLTLVGDSLIEPFWPTGSGAGRGVLSSLDCAWMIKQYCGGNPPLAVIRERENIFKLLSGTTNDSLQKNYKAFTIDPKTRYTAFDSKKVSNIAMLKTLYDTDDKENADYTVMSPQSTGKDVSATRRRRRSSSGSRKKSLSHVTSTYVHPHGGASSSTKINKRKTERSQLKEKTEEKPKIGDTKQFWEEHNKKNLEDKARQHVSKPRKKTPSIEEEIEAMEGWSEIDDDVIAEAPVIKENLSVRSTRSTGKSPREHSLKRNRSRDRLLVKRQKSRENLQSQKFMKAKTPEREQKSQGKGTMKRETTKRKTSTVKQDPARPVDPKGFFRIWMEKLSSKFIEHTAEIQTNDVTQGVTSSLCSQTAAISVMAMPLLFDCNRPPKRRTTDIKLKDLQLAKKALLQPTDAHKESKEISLKRVGSVKDTIAKLKEITSKDEKASDYYEFLRRNHSGTDLDKRDGKPSKTVDDFTPKVIDIEKAVLKDEQLEEQKAKAVKSIWQVSSNDNEHELRRSLEEFFNQQTPLGGVLMLQVLYNIHKRISDEPTVEKYYRIYIKGTVFEKYVWTLEGAEKYLFTSGWIKCGNYIVLSKSYPVASSLKVIHNFLRKKKKPQVSHSASDRQPASKRPDTSNRRRVKSNVGDIVIDEDEIVASYTNIESDSAADSGVDDGEVNSFRNSKLRRVESKEHLFNDEEYIVVDFIGNLEVSSSRKSSQVEDAARVNDSPPESAIGLSPPPGSPVSASPTFDDVTASQTGEEVLTDVDLQLEDDDIEKQQTEEQSVERKEDVDLQLEDDGVEKQQTKKQSVEQKEETVIEKKHFFAAGRGLKGLKKTRPEEEKKIVKTSPAPIHPDNFESGSSSMNGSNSSLENVGIEKLSRSSSTRSVNSSKSMSSQKNNDKISNTVLQNKLLFDNQIANQLRCKTPSEPSSGSNSLMNSRKSSLRSLNEIPTAGTVASARSMFEATSTPNTSKKGKHKKAPVKTGSDKPIVKDIQFPQIDVKNESSSTKKKSFPFKKKKATINSQKELGKKSVVPVTDCVKLMSVKPSKESYEERAIDVPASDVSNESVEADKEDFGEKKKKGGIFSKMRRLSRKSSGGESSDNESEKVIVSLPAEMKLEDDVIQECESELCKQTQRNETEKSTLILPTLNADSSMPVLMMPDVLPPSPNAASSEVSAVLKSIIDRTPSCKVDEENGGAPKKKKLKMKKKSSSKKSKQSSTNKEADHTASPEFEKSPSQKNDMIVEDVSETIIRKDEDLPDWPEELIEGKVEDPYEPQIGNVDPLDYQEQTVNVIDDVMKSQPVKEIDDSTIASVKDDDDDKSEEAKRNGDAELIVKASPMNNNKDILIIPGVTIGSSSDVEVNRDDDENDELASTLDDVSFYSNEGDAVFIDTTDGQEKKKKKLKIKFPGRKSSKKNKTLSPTKETQIWEEHSSKLEKKNSKKLKRPKSLDFLADVISHAKKPEENREQLRPFSITQFEDLQNGEKSPGKKKTLNFFKKKKKPIHVSVNTSGSGEHYTSGSLSSPDVFKIPDVVDGQQNTTKNGHKEVSVSLSAGL